MKHFALIFSIILLFSLISCSKNNGDLNNTVWIGNYTNDSNRQFWVAYAFSDDSKTVFRGY